MSINAYTFEKKDGIQSNQIKPYSAKDDARVRRDLFRQNGDLIVVGDRRNGRLNVDDVGNISNTITFRLNNSVTMVAGGRIFSLTNQDVTLSAKALRSVDGYSIGVFDLVFDINIDAPDGEFIKLVASPSYDVANGDTSVWEGSKFSVVYKLIGVSTGGNMAIYPSPEFNGAFAAGTASMMSGSGVLMAGGISSAWRGPMLVDSSCLLSHVGPNAKNSSESIFTMIGDIGQVSGIDGDLFIGLKDGRCPYYLQTNDSSDNVVVITTNIGVLVGKIVAEDESSEYSFRIVDLTFDNPELSTSDITSVNIFGSFVASWGYWA